eukprot:99326-Amphidinium_carterae.2
MHRVRGLGLPAHVKARIVKSLHSVGLYGAEVGGIPKSGMTRIRTAARKACKGAGLRRSAPLELMAHGGPAADPQVSADLSTVRVWHRRILAGKLDWPLTDARLLPTDSSSLMGRVMTARLPSMQRLEEFGTKNVRTPPSKSGIYVSAVVRKLRTLSTSFFTAHIGTKSDVRLAYRLTQRLFRRV